MQKICNGKTGQQATNRPEIFWQQSPMLSTARELMAMAGNNCSRRESTILAKYAEAAGMRAKSANTRAIQ